MLLDTIERIGGDALLLLLVILGVRYLVLPLGRLILGLTVTLRQANDRRQLELDHDRAIALSRLDAEKARLAAQEAEQEAIAQLPLDQLQALALRNEGIRHTQQLIKAWRMQQAAANTSNQRQFFRDFVLTHQMANAKPSIGS
jgi:hypothetical protein